MTAPSTAEAHCPICGNAFDRHKVYQVYCSSTCKELARKQRSVARAVLLRCSACGSLFTRNKGQHGPYCSRACRRKAHARPARARRSVDTAQVEQLLREGQTWNAIALELGIPVATVFRSVPRPPREPISCRRCGVLFTPKSSHQVYCSYQCQQRRPAKQPAQAQSLPCLNCGTLFTRKQPRQVYCSGRCGSRHWKQRKRAAGPQRRPRPRFGEHAERLYSFLVDYLTRKHFAPTSVEIAAELRCSHTTAKKTLEYLQEQGRIKVHPWARGITLTDAPKPDPVSFEEWQAQRHPAPPLVLTVDQAIDWKALAKAFQGIAAAKLTENSIGRYFRARCQKVGRDKAVREANVLLGLRFPEIFLERHPDLAALDQFLDHQVPKRGCKSCHKKYRKIRPNQLYCSATCRRREKRHRRQATPQGKKLKSQQNKRYEFRHEERQRERRRQWRLDHKLKLQRQREREATRRALARRWAQGLKMLPQGVATVRLEYEQAKKAG